MKTFTINFKNIGKQSSLRLDFGYRYFFDYKKGVIFDEYKKDTIKLKYVLNLLQNQKVKKGELEQPEKLIDLGNIERRFNNLINVEEVEEIGSDKNILQDGDLIIPKMQPQMGNIFLNLNHERFIGSTELLEYKINDNFRPTFLYYLITSKRFLNDLAKLESGKTHRRVNPDDLLKIKIPLIPKPTQDQIVSKIEPIEKQIKELKSQIKDPQEIINQVFAREFGFDLEKFEESKKEKFFEVDFSDLSNNFLLISKVKYHKYSLDFLKNISTIRLKNIVSFIKSGNAENYEIVNEEGNYISVEDLKIDGSINSYKLTYSKSKDTIKIGDILFSRVGSKLNSKNIPIGIVKYDYQTFASDNILIIRLNKFNNEFIMFFLKSIFGNKQIRKAVKTKGQPVINSTALGNIKIPNIPLQDQQKIVDKIKKELDKQQDFKKQIEEKRNDIDEIIEETIK